MEGIATLLDSELTERVETIWAELDRDFGVRGVVQLTPIAHFSWLVATEFEEKMLRDELESVACTIAPFTVHTSGLGVFTGPSPIVYVPVVCSAALSTVHRMLWERLAPGSHEMNAYYAPDAWMPHITLAMGDVTPANLPHLVERLGARDFAWQIRVDNLVLIDQPDGQAARASCRAVLGRR
jgi:2'-5' RNA ligase